MTFEASRMKHLHMLKADLQPNKNKLEDRVSALLASSTGVSVSLPCRPPLSGQSAAARSSDHVTVNHVCASDHVTASSAAQASRSVVTPLRQQSLAALRASRY